MLLRTACCTHPVFEVVRNGERVAIVMWAKTDASVDTMLEKYWVIPAFPVMQDKALH